MRRIDPRHDPSRDERGATALMIAILLPTVLLGLGAIVVNVGGWYVARGMDQNAADAAVIAVAESCADGSCDPSKANQYANSVSNGQLAGQTMFVCGTAPGLAGCAGGVENGKVCPPPHAAPYVDVLVTPEGGSMENFTSGTQEVGACAQAALDSVGSCEDCAALTLSECEWKMNTSNGTAFANPGSIPTYLNTITARRESSLFGSGPSNNFFQKAKIYDPMNPKAGYTPTPSAPANATIAGSETVIKAQGSFGTSCGSSSPGNFEWLAHSGCSAAIDSDGTFGGDTGADVPDCEELFANSRDTGEPIYLPVFSSKTRSGSNVKYTLAGFAAFVVTGWDMNTGAGTWDNKMLPSKIGQARNQPAGSKKGQYCGKSPNGYTTDTSNDQCVYGYFTKALVPNGPFGGGGGLPGLTVASLTG